jgi:hypothetical protein
MYALSPARTHAHFANRSGTGTAYTHSTHIRGTPPCTHAWYYIYTHSHSHSLTHTHTNLAEHGGAGHAKDDAGGVREHGGDLEAAGALDVHEEAVGCGV